MTELGEALELFTRAHALLAVGALLCVHTVLVGAELVAIRASFARGGLFHGPALRPQTRRARLLAKIGSTPHIVGFALARVLLGVVIGAALWAGVEPCSLALAPAWLLLAALATTQLFVLSLGNDASDSIALVSAAALGLASLAGPAPAVEEAALWFIALQSALSYVTAGAVKLGSAPWRSGEFLRFVARSELYGHPLSEALMSRRPVAVGMTWFIMLWESSFVAALLEPRAALVYVAIGLGFHLHNAALMGLNRFLIAFAATYPAIVYASVSLARGEAWTTLAGAFGGQP